MRKLLGFLLGVFILSIASIGYSASINQVAYDSLTGTGMIDFEDISGGTVAGTNYDYVFTSGGAQFGERFSGQSITYNGNFDIITGPPTSMSLVAGAANENLNVATYYGSNVLSGLGPLGFPDFDAIGEGAFSVLFTYDQSEFGFQLIGGNEGSGTIDFYARDNSLIESITLTNLADNYYGFSREGGTNDIAGISIDNFDFGGIAFDNLLHDVPNKPVPVPATILLLGLGLLGVVGVSRRKK